MVQAQGAKVFLDYLDMLLVESLQMDLGALGALTVL